MINLSHNADVLFETVVRKYPDLLDVIRKKKYTVKDTELSYRQLNSLDKSDLVENSRISEQNWRKFNLNDLLYLHIVNKMREFNTNNSQLRPMNELFYRQKINYVVVGEVLFTEEAIVTMLTGYVPIGILIFSDGQVILTDDPAITVKIGSTDPNRRSCIFIGLYETFKPYLKRVKEDPAFRKKYRFNEFENVYSTKLITKEERALLKIVSDNEYSQISIVKKPDGKLVVYAERSVDGTRLTAEDIMEVFQKQEFGDINVNKRDGRIQNLKVKDVFKI